MSEKSIKSQLGLKHFHYPDKYGEWLGYKMLKFDRKKQSVEGSLKIRKDHLSPAGRVHGGVISGFFDFACGAAAFTTMDDSDFCSTVELKVNYFLPIELGDNLIIQTKVVFRGRKICVIHGYIYRKNETQPTAMATATFNIVADKQLIQL
ncbi:MAG: PaaI family thioesterase [Cytophagales bacterium]|nr:PaaI family thioesterase [Cytophagales bacterium]